MRCRALLGRQLLYFPYDVPLGPALMELAENLTRRGRRGCGVSRFGVVSALRFRGLGLGFFGFEV